MAGRVELIHLFPERGGEPEARDEVRAVAGCGLEGDRYFEEGLDPARQLTLVDAAVLEEVAEADPTLALQPGESRRQLTTSGIDLNALVGREFTVGKVRCRGIELCEPCSHLEQFTGRAGIMRALVHRGGLNAEILEGGTIAVGDPVAPGPS
jgi:MOSC domain-containing protein YiiM